MNGCAPGLALIERLKATRKWAIMTATGSLTNMKSSRTCLDVLKGEGK